MRLNKMNEERRLYNFSVLHRRGEKKITGRQDRVGQVMTQEQDDWETRRAGTKDFYISRMTSF